MRRIRRALIGVAALGLLAACGPPGVTHTGVVTVASGQVRGMVGDGVQSFLGIPYAAPPIGALRWRAPQPPAPWTGVRDVVSPGSRCPQSGQAGTEDCLYLNVRTPFPVRSHLPVMVWIHGGGLVTGAGSDYDAGPLVRKGQVIVVTINYRLGVFGFLDLPALAAEAPDHSGGMYWLQDQQAALRWVQTNIAAFGGDPANVTIFGQSAGGQSICYSLASPLSVGLFQRAIIESGPCAQQTQPAATAQALGERFARQVGCANPATVLDCVRTVPIPRLLNTTSGGPSVLEPWTPNVDGAELKVSEAIAISSGAFNRVPTIDGTTHDEFRLFVWQYADSVGKPVTAGGYAAALRAEFGGQAQQVLDQYPLSAYASPSLALSTVGTDALLSCPAFIVDRALTASVPTYAFEFSDPNLTVPVHDPVMSMGAPHGAELPFLFAAPQATLSPAQRALSDRMIAYWTSFAATGVPEAPGAAAWPRYTAAGDQVLELTSAPTRPAVDFARDHRCAFWSAQPRVAPLP
jgi:para-nitrobenzyl esterase